VCVCENDNSFRETSKTFCGWSIRDAACMCDVWRVNLNLVEDPAAVT